MLKSEWTWFDDVYEHWQLRTQTNFYHFLAALISKWDIVGLTLEEGRIVYKKKILWPCYFNNCTLFGLDTNNMFNCTMLLGRQKKCKHPLRLDMWRSLLIDDCKLLYRKCPDVLCRAVISSKSIVGYKKWMTGLSPFQVNQFAEQPSWQCPPGSYFLSRQ